MYEEIAALTITRSLKKITLTPNFGQAQVTLDCEISIVASRPGRRETGFLSPPAPRAWSAGPVGYRVRFILNNRVRFNPQTTFGPVYRPDFY